MDVKAWFDLVEHEIRDNESLIVTSELGIPVIGKVAKNLNEREVAEGIANIVKHMRNIGVGLTEVVCEGDSMNFVIFDWGSYIVCAIGERFDRKFLQRIKKIFIE